MTPSHPKPLRIGVVGATGRMGRAVVRLATEDEGLCVAAAIAAERAGSDIGELSGTGRLGVLVTSDLASLGGAALDVLVDFSLAAFVPQLALAAARAGVPLVSGTTGLSEEGAQALEQAAKSIPVFWSANMSVGVYVLACLVEAATRLLGDGFDLEITETHHRKKEDAPSGTALRLAEAARKGRGEALSPSHGRHGRPGPRLPNELGMHALRGGDVIGDHTVFFFGDGERIELTHRASSRDLFALGALRAARFVAGRAPGAYTMQDLLGAG